MRLGVACLCTLHVQLILLSSTVRRVVLVGQLHLSVLVAHVASVTEPVVRHRVVLGHAQPALVALGQLKRCVWLLFRAPLEKAHALRARKRVYNACAILRRVNSLGAVRRTTRMQKRKRKESRY